MWYQSVAWSMLICRTCIKTTMSRPSCFFIDPPKDPLQRVRSVPVLKVTFPGIHGPSSVTIQFGTHNILYQTIYLYYMKILSNALHQYITKNSTLHEYTAWHCPWRCAATIKWSSLTNNILHKYITWIHEHIACIYYMNTSHDIAHDVVQQQPTQALRLGLGVTNETLACQSSAGHRYKWLPF